MATVTSYTKSGMDYLLTEIKFIQRSVKTASYTLADGDENTRIDMNVSASHDLIVPTLADSNLAVGCSIVIVQVGAGLTTIVADTSVTIRSLNDYLTSAGQYARILLEHIQANEWYASGDLVAA